MVMLFFAAALVASAPEPPNPPDVSGDAQIAAAAPAEPPVERGVSESLAAERAAIVRDLRYELHFTVPGVIKDVERLKLLYELFGETLDQLSRIGSAYERNPNVAV